MKCIGNEKCVTDSMCNAGVQLAVIVLHLLTTLSRKSHLND